MKVFATSKTLRCRLETINWSVQRIFVKISAYNNNLFAIWLVLGYPFYLKFCFWRGRFEVSIKVLLANNLEQLNLIVCTWLLIEIKTLMLKNYQRSNCFGEKLNNVYYLELDSCRILLLYNNALGKQRGTFLWPPSMLLSWVYCINERILKTRKRKLTKLSFTYNFM